jgi:hypothetical protein
MVTDPFRIRDTTPASDNDDGISDSVSTKLIGIGLTLLGAALVAPQCESNPMSQRESTSTMTDMIVVLTRLVGDRASTAQIKTITYFTTSLAFPM